MLYAYATCNEACSLYSAFQAARLGNAENVVLLAVAQFPLENLVDYYSTHPSIHLSFHSSFPNEPISDALSSQLH